VKSGELGFVELPQDEALLKQSIDFAARAGDRWEDVVILGIGGSALGPIALRTALRPHAWNTLSREERGGKPRLTVLRSATARPCAAREAPPTRKAATIESTGSISRADIGPPAKSIA